MRFLYRAVFLVIAIFLILFAVSNRETVSVGFWPLPFLADVPLYLLCFLSLLIGALIGAAIAWMAGHRKRRDARVGRNPRTGDSVPVAEKHIPFFKTGKQLRDRLNQSAG